MRVLAIFRAAWSVCGRFWPVILALSWLSALCWLGLQRPHGGVEAANRLDRVVATPSGLLTVMGKGWSGRVLSQIGRFAEAGATPIPAPHIEGLFGTDHNGVDFREHRLSLLVFRPIRFLLIYSALVAWAAWTLRTLDGEHEVGRLAGLSSTWARVAYVGALWLALLQVARLAAMIVVQRYGDLGSTAPRDWLGPSLAWILAGLHLAGMLAMCASAQRGGMFWSSARSLAEVVRTRGKDLGPVLLVGGALVLFSDWVVRTAEMMYWPRSHLLASGVALGVIWARAVVGVWALIALLMVFGRRPIEHYLVQPAPSSKEPAPRKRSRRRRKT